jgi:serine/threonine protein kinase
MQHAGQTLGRYKILSELGRGAMGAVYRAVDPLIEREVAIKTLLPDLPEEVMEAVRERFLREARSAGRLNHPNIVTIHDVGVQDGVAYIAMELLEGQSLQQVMKSGERMSYSTAADLVAQVADALDYAQRFSIVHRDVKPANIMLDAHGRAKLTDFGVARLPSSEMTQTGDTLGSPKYMSPEQVLGQPADPRADIFSLGIVLFEMLTGVHPFVQPNDTAFSLMHRIAGEPHLPLRTADPQVPAGFVRIVDRALGKKPADRYQRAAEMASDLRNWKGVASPDKTGTLVLDKAKPTQVAKAPLPPKPKVDTPRPKVDTSSLIGDLDGFAANFEAEQEKQVEAERLAKERRQKELDAAPKPWQPPDLGEILAQAPQPAYREPAAPASPADSTPGTKRQATLDALKSQAPPAGSAPAAQALTRREREILAVDKAMRDADRYLNEVAGQIGKVNPRTQKPYAFRFIGPVNPAVVTQAEVYSATTRVEGREVSEFIKVVLRVAPAKPQGASLQGSEINACVDFFKSHKAEHEFAIEKKNDFGVTIRARVTLFGSIPCELMIRADYQNPGAAIELNGVRRLGRYKGEVDPDEIEEAIDELVRYFLGTDDRFERFVDRAG